MICILKIDKETNRKFNLIQLQVFMCDRMLHNVLSIRDTKFAKYKLDFHSKLNYILKSTDGDKFGV